MDSVKIILNLEPELQAYFEYIPLVRPATKPTVTEKEAMFMAILKEACVAPSKRDVLKLRDLVGRPAEHTLSLTLGFVYDEVVRSIPKAVCSDVIYKYGLFEFTFVSEENAGKKRPMTVTVPLGTEFCNYADYRLSNEDLKKIAGFDVLEKDFTRIVEHAALPDWADVHADVYLSTNKVIRDSIVGKVKEAIGDFYKIRPGATVLMVDRIDWMYSITLGESCE